MYGVIIWIEEKSGNALIWCDDHGQLAYFVAAEMHFRADRFFCWGFG